MEKELVRKLCKATERLVLIEKRNLRKVIEGFSKEYGIPYGELSNAIFKESIETWNPSIWYRGKRDNNRFSFRYVSVLVGEENGKDNYLYS